MVKLCLTRTGLLTDLVGFVALGLVVLSQQALRPLAPAEDRPGE